MKEDYIIRDNILEDSPVPEAISADTNIRTTFNLDRHSKWEQFKVKYIEPNHGLLLLTVSHFFHSLMVVSTKLLETDPTILSEITPLQILVIRMSITYLGTLIYMFYYKSEIKYVPFGDPAIRKWLILRGCMGFFGVFGTYFAVMYLSISDAVLISFLAPSLTIILAWVVLKERVHTFEFIGGLVSLLGVILIVRPPFLFGSSGESSDISKGESQNPKERLLATTVALFGVIGLSSVYVLIRFIGNRAHAIMNVSYFSLIALTISGLGIILIPSMRLQIPQTSKEWFLYTVLGISGFAHQLLLTFGIQMERAGRGSLIAYTQLIYAIIWDVTLYHHWPSIWSWCGMFVIIGSTLYVIKLRSNMEESEKPVVPLSDEESFEIPLEEM